MSANSDTTKTAKNLGETMTEVGDMMTDLSVSMAEAADGFEAFTDSTRTLSASRSGGNFAASDD